MGEPRAGVEGSISARVLVRGRSSVIAPTEATLQPRQAVADAVRRRPVWFAA